MKKFGLKNNIAAFILISFSFSHSFSQEKMGIENSNYSSTNSIYLNPASSVDSRTFINMNLIGVNAYVMTNLAYLPKFSMWRAASFHSQPVIDPGTWSKFLYGNFALDGPAVVISHRRIGIGLFVRVRSMIDIRNIPYQLTKILLPQKLDTTVPSEVSFDVRNAKISNMTWAEYGLNFGGMIKKHNGLLITAGGNLKYLTGIDLMYANLNRFDAYMKDRVINVKELNGTIRSSQGGWGSGKGVGLDLGVQYRRALKSETEYEGYYVNSKRSNCENIDYLYKAGISILDLGYINFDTKTYKADVNGSLYIADYKKVKNLDSLIRDGFHATQEREVPIMTCLPTALSAQLDLNMSHHIYLNGTIIAGIVPTSFTGVQRANQLSITPRYERKQFEVAVPLTFHRFIYPQLGLAVRIRSCVFGVDNVLPLMIATDTYGLNAYFNLGISLFKNPACRVKHYRKKKEKTKKRDTSACPKFGKRNILGF